MKNKSSAVFYIFLLIVILGLAGGGAYLYFLFEKQKALVAEKIESIAPFSELEQTKEICGEAKIDYPPRTPDKKLDDLQNELKKELEKEVSAKFNRTELSKKQFAIIKDFSAAKIGQYVTFFVSEAAGKKREIKGIYRNRKSEKNGVFIIIETESVPFNRIIPDFQYLFDENIAVLTQEKKFEELKKATAAEKEEFIAKIKSDYENKIIVAAGYVKDPVSGNWILPAELVKTELAKRLAKYKKTRQKKINEIIDNNKFLGIISISIENLH